MKITITADDYGWSPDSVEATSACLLEGSITNASLMTGAPAFEQALAFSKNNSQFCYGIHLTLAGRGRLQPAAPRANVGTLLNKEGHLGSLQRFRALALLGRIDPRHIEAEIGAQIALARDAGVSIAYVDSHHHVHKLPMVTEALNRVLPKFGIDRVRCVQNFYVKPAYTKPTYWFGKFQDQKLRKRWRTTDWFYMPATLLETGWQEPLLQRLPSNTLEIGAHPGTVEDWRKIEFDDIRAFARLARAARHELVSWVDIV